jgi:hypothetical protein
MMSIDHIATAFLRNFEAVKQEVQKPAEIVHVEDTHTTENVIVARSKEPRFYGGTLGKGDSQRPVWVHDPKQARHIDGDRVHLYEERLGEELFPLWPYAR